MHWFNLKSVTIPNGVKSIGKRAFTSTALEAITIPSGVKSIGMMAFANTQLKSVMYAFSSCYTLKKIVIPEKVISIPEQAFSSCSSLTSVTIPYGVVNIEALAFESCTNLTAVRLPKTVKTISERAFGRCENLKLTVINEEAAIDQTAFMGNDESFTIRCIENSTAHTYALQNNIPYELIDLSLVTEYFADVATGAWYTDAVCWAYANGITTGYKL